MSLREELKNRLPRKCAQCGAIIYPNDGEIWTMGENLYCSRLCAVEAAGIERIDRRAEHDYLDCFPKKSEDLFAREEQDDEREEA